MREKHMNLPNDQSSRQMHIRYYCSTIRNGNLEIKDLDISK